MDAAAFFVRVDGQKAERPSSERVPLQVASTVNEVWSMDFVSDSLANGRRLKCDSQLLADLILTDGDIKSTDFQTPPLNRNQCTQQSKQRCLARPIRSQEPE
jgi:hypothetical protein